jgi:hypothetical protein
MVWPTGNAATKVSFHDASRSSEASSMKDLVGYVLETLRVGSEYILYRGRRASVAAPILVLAPAAVQQSPANVNRLEHEYALASELDPLWAVRASCPRTSRWAHDACLRGPWWRTPRSTARPTTGCSSISARRDPARECTWPCACARIDP